MITVSLTGKHQRNACVQDYMYLLGCGARNVTDFAIKSSHWRACTASGPVAVNLDVRPSGWANTKWICSVLC